MVPPPDRPAVASLPKSSKGKAKGASPKEADLDDDAQIQKAVSAQKFLKSCWRRNKFQRQIFFRRRKIVGDE